jgi:hypothetical protein
MMQDANSTTPKWTINQRMALSFNITSSIMQFHSTPWLPSPLTSSSIRFISDSLKFANIPQPFISYPESNDIPMYRKSFTSGARNNAP